MRIQNIWQRLAYSSLRSQLKFHSRNSIYLEKLITISFTGTFIEYILHTRLHIIFKILSHLIHSNLPRQVFLLTCIYKEAQMRMNNCPRTQNQKIAKTGFKDPGSNLGYCDFTTYVLRIVPSCFKNNQECFRYKSGPVEDLPDGGSCQLPVSSGLENLKLLMSVMQTVIPKQILSKYRLLQLMLKWFQDHLVGMLLWEHSWILLEYIWGIFCQKVGTFFF